MQADGHRGPGRHRLERDLEAVPAEDSRVDPARDVAQLLERDRDLLPRLNNPLACIGIRRNTLCEQAQLERQRDQALLRTIVKIALESLALLLSSVDHPRA